MNLGICIVSPKFPVNWNSIISGTFGTPIQYPPDTVLACDKNTPSHGIYSATCTIADMIFLMKFCQYSLLSVPLFFLDFTAKYINIPRLITNAEISP